MSQIIELCDCHHGNESQLLLTRQILQKVKRERVKLQQLRKATSIRLVDRSGSSSTNHKDDVRINLPDPEADVFELYLQILLRLKVFSRLSRNIYVPLLLGLTSGPLESYYTEFLDREIFHIELVRQVASVDSLETAARHDHTKDAFNAYVLCGKFGAIRAEENPEFEHVYEAELDRHFREEPHHPEWEKLREIKCRDCDIREMAIDRLARNVVAAEGEIDKDKMELYLPKFTLGDVGKKLERYDEHVQELHPFVIDEYRKLLAKNRDQDQPKTVDSEHATDGIRCKGTCARVKLHYTESDELVIELRRASTDWITWCLDRLVPLTLNTMDYYRRYISPAIRT